MDTRQEYLQKINEIHSVSYNNDQKDLAKKIISTCDEADLQAVFGLITKRIKTGFVFDEAPEVNHNAVSLVEETPELNINLSGLDSIENKIEHKLIIGENYDALKNLCASYIDKNGKGLIDVIYIDPPYNTEKSKEDGNDYKDNIQANKFVYRDKFTRDGWLNMMNERLKLARRLLCDKGVIFISIDDSEQAYLKVLCDEIFGEENFVATWKWNKTATPPSLSKKVRTKYEYILCYEKYRNNTEFYAGNVDGGDMPLLNENNTFHQLIFPKDNLYFKIDGHFEAGKYGNVQLVKSIIVTEGRANCDVVLQGNFKWEQKTLQYEVENGTQFIIKSNKFAVRYIRLGERNKRPSDIISMEECGVGTNETASKELFSIMGNTIQFSYPKPTSLIKYLALFNHNSSATILDFFAGSGTTGQAVMELNAQDGGKRKFILVTNDENEIGTKITRERLFRVINGKGSKGEEIAWKYTDSIPCLSGNCVRVFGLHTEELSLKDLTKAEKLKDQAKIELKKLSPHFELDNDLDIYYTLSALNPQQKAE